jgi:predicted GIY-YIG superfamily endonuclease
MAELDTLTFKGLSGTSYSATAYALTQQFNAVGAVYIITKRYVQSGTTYYQPLYIGVTGDLSTRFNDHHKDACFTRNGANSICIHRDENEKSRFAKETDLIQQWNPTCNG